MRQYDLVRVRGSHRLWVALRVDRRDIRRGLFTRRTGLHLFGGFWYGETPTDKASYGKMVPAVGRVVGTLRGKARPSAYLKSKLY